MDEETLNPSYYKAGTMDVIAFCEEHEIGFSEGNVIKYVVRAGKKKNESRLKDLMKARRYLERMIESENRKQNEDIRLRELQSCTEHA